MARRAIETPFFVSLVMGVTPFKYFTTLLRESQAKLVTVEEAELLLSDIFHHPGLYQEFITPVNDTATQTLPLKDWLNEDHFGTVRPYQIPALPWDHMLPSDVPIDRAYMPGYKGIDRKDLGEAYECGGRSTSKSWGLVHDATQTPCVRRGEETLVTSRDDNHLTKRLDTIKIYVTQHPLLSELVSGKAKWNEPYARVEFVNGHVIKGIYESTSGEGENYVGEKFHRKLIDEFQLTSMQAWKNLHDATADGQGCVVRATGVSDGRRDTPMHKIRTDTEKQAAVYKKPQYLSESWTPRRKRDAIDEYGGIDSQDYKTNVDAEEGEEVSTVWNLRDILLCTKVPKEDQRKNLDNKHFVQCPILQINKQDIDEEGLPSPARFPEVQNIEWPIFIPVDIGWKRDPTIAGVFGIEPVKDEFKIHQWGNIEMLHVDYSDQAAILLEMAKHYKADGVGIDYTGSDGTAVAQEWERLDDPYIDEVWFVKWDTRVPILVEGQKRFGRKKEPDKKVDKRHFITLRMMTRFGNRMAELLYDDSTILEFRTEVKKPSTSRASTYEFLYSAPKGDHRIAMMRILEYMLYLSPTRQKQKRMQDSLWSSDILGLGRI